MRTTTNRLARITAGLTLATSVVLAAAPAGALPIGGGTGDGASDAEIHGVITTGTCDNTPRVSATWSMGGVAASGNAMMTRISAGHYAYSFMVTAPANVKITGTAPGACPWGTWSTQSGSVSVSANSSVTGPTLAYVPPKAVTTVPSSIITGAVRLALQDMALHLNSYRAAVVNGSHYVANSSSFTIGGTAHTLNIPDIQKPIIACSICPVLGTAQFQVRDINATSHVVSWTPNVGLNVALAFEENGPEVKGFYKNMVSSRPFDLLMPDLEISRPSITATFYPTLDGLGGITLGSPRNPVFSGTVQAAGACSVPLIPLVDLCDLATGYKDTVTQSIGNAAEAALTDKAVRDMVGAQIRAQLDALHIGTVRNVAIDGDNVIIVE